MHIAYGKAHGWDAVWDGTRWVSTGTDTYIPWVIDMTAEIVRQNSSRFVKRAPLGMHLTRDDGFRMVK